MILTRGTSESQRIDGCRMDRRRVHVNFIAVKLGILWQAIIYYTYTYYTYTYYTYTYYTYTYYTYTTWNAACKLS